MRRHSRGCRRHLRGSGYTHVRYKEWLGERKGREMTRTVFCASAALAMFWFVWAGAGAGYVSGTAVPQRPPPGLTAAGRLTWNFEALINDVFGGRAQVCETIEGNISTAACSLPLSKQTPYLRLFAAAKRSSFQRVRSAPRDLGNGIPLRIGGRYIVCGLRKWLVRARPGIMCVSPP